MPACQAGRRILRANVFVEVDGGRLGVEEAAI
jgi:hypothetical protein